MYRMLFALVAWMLAMGFAMKDAPAPERSAKISTETETQTPVETVARKAPPAGNLVPMKEMVFHHAQVTTTLVPVSFSNTQDKPELVVHSPDAPAGYVPKIKPEPITQETASATPLYEVTGSRVNMRAGPSTQHGVVAALGRGTQTLYLGEHDGWAQIKVIKSGQRGFMAAKFLRPLNAQN